MTNKQKRYGRLLILLGLASLAPYLYALRLQDLRQHTISYEVVFFVAFAFYAAATAVVLRMEAFSRRATVASFALAAVFHGLLLFTPPTLSDDMYRYVWDGRVQARGLSPYAYPPDAPELQVLRDEVVWPQINRRSAVTVYPPGAQMVFATLWRLVPDSVRSFQLAMSVGALLAGAMLLGLLQSLKRSPALVLVYLWSPLLAFETAHAGHVDGLVLPLLVGAWWATVRERDGLVGLLLGLATALKLYPILLLPALWRPRHSRGRWRLPTTFGLALAACYLPYFLTSRAKVLGYLPNYLEERFNMGLAGLLVPVLQYLGVDAQAGMMVLMLGALTMVSVVLIARPAPDGETAVRRSIWMMGAFTLTTQNLFPWYLLWMLPLLPLFLRPGRLFGLRADAWTGWWLFGGLVALAYTFFIEWRPVRTALWAEFLPLYALLWVGLWRWVRTWHRSPEPAHG